MQSASTIDQHGFKKILTRNVTLPLVIGVVSVAIFVAIVSYLLSVLAMVEQSERVIRQGNEVSKLAVDQETGQRLSDTRDDEKQRHQQTQLRIAQPEVADEDREQRRQQQVEEVRGAVRQADQADDGVVAAGAGRRRGGWGQHGTHGRERKRWRRRPR